MPDNILRYSARWYLEYAQRRPAWPLYPQKKSLAARQKMQRKWYKKQRRVVRMMAAEIASGAWDA